MGCKSGSKHLSCPEFCVTVFWTIKKPLYEGLGLIVCAWREGIVREPAELGLARKYPNYVQAPDRQTCSVVKMFLTKREAGALWVRKEDSWIADWVAGRNESMSVCNINSISMKNLLNLCGDMSKYCTFHYYNGLRCRRDFPRLLLKTKVKEAFLLFVAWCEINATSVRPPPRGPKRNS